MSVFAAPRAFLRDAAIAAAYELGLLDGAVVPETHRLRALVAVLRALEVPPTKPDVPRAGWGLLADVIRTDRPLAQGELAPYHQHLLRAGAPAAAEVARLVRGERLLDLGGGAGAYTAAFLDAHPAARATLVDRDEVIALAGDHLARFGERVALVAGDAREVAVAPHDVVLLANVLHLHGPAACAELCAAAARAVAPGGTVAVVDLAIEPDRSGPIDALLFALGMAIYTDEGDVHDAGRIGGWLAEAGLIDVRVERLASDPSAMVVLATRPALDMPGRFQRALAMAMQDGVPGVREHYLERMPRQRAAQLAGSLFHAPLDWRRLPRLERAIGRLEAVLADAGVEYAVPRARTLEELYAGTYYGAFMPLLAYVPRDGEPHAIIERYLVAPIIHELCHLGRHRPGGLEPLHLDECVAGWLGVYVYPGFAYPEPGHDDAIYAAPWLAQVGQAFARAFGVREVIRAHAGLGELPRDVIDGAMQLGRAHRTVHLLADTLDPAPWVELALGRGVPDDPAFDRMIVEDALRAMCLENTLVDGSLRVATRLPARAVIADGWIVGEQHGAVDRIAPRYWLPRWIGSHELEIVDVARTADVISSR